MATIAHRDETGWGWCWGHMIYDALTVTLLTMLSGEGRDTTNALLARYLLEHAGELEGLSVKELAARAHVGTGTVSRFARDAGFDGFADLREAFAGFGRSFVPAPGEDGRARAHAIAEHIGQAMAQVEHGIDRRALDRLVDDLRSYGKVLVFGLLKGQAAASDLQVDLLMQGKYVETCTAFADQARRIAGATRDELVVLFSFTGSYFGYRDLSKAMRRLDRPKIWMVCGQRAALPDYVADRLVFESDLDRASHPFQLEYVAALIAQEYAARQAGGEG